MGGFLAGLTRNILSIMLVKNKNCKDYTDTVKSVYCTLSNKFGYLARVSNFWELLKCSLGLNKFEIFNPRLINNGGFEAYLIDQQIDWQEGRDVNFTDIYESLLSIGEFTQSEKILLSSSNIEERLWAIYLVMCDPQMDDILNNN